MILSATLGLTTLIMAISACATLLPTIHRMGGFGFKRRVILSQFWLQQCALPRANVQRFFCRKLVDEDDHIVFKALLQDRYPHAVVNTTRAKASLGDFKSSAFAKQYIFPEHAHYPLDFHVTMRCIIIAENRQWSPKLQRLVYPQGRVSWIAVGDGARQNQSYH